MAEVTAPPSRPCWDGALEWPAALGEPVEADDGYAGTDDAGRADLLAETGDRGVGAGQHVRGEAAGSLKVWDPRAAFWLAQPPLCCAQTPAPRTGRHPRRLDDPYVVSGL